MLANRFSSGPDWVFAIAVRRAAVAVLPSGVLGIMKPTAISEWG